MVPVRRTLSLIVAFALLLAGFSPLPAVAADMREGALPFTDLGGTPYQRSVELMWRLKVVSGFSDTRFAPDALVTRAQMAAFLIRAMGRGELASARQGSTAFIDVPADHWAAGSVTAANEIGLIKGDEQRRFRPDDLVNFAEAITMLVRASGHEALVTGTWPTGHIEKAGELELLEGLKVDRVATVTRGELVQMLSALVFNAENPVTGRTLNQSVFQLAERLEITPDSLVIPRGKVRVEARLWDPAGKELPVVPILKEDTGKLILERGTLLVPAGIDAVTLRAQHASLSTDRSYSVYGGDDLAIEPAEASVHPGEQVALKATVPWLDGRLPVAPVWMITAGAAEVDETGKVKVQDTAGGTVTVQAQFGDLVRTARITVADRLVVEPADAFTAPGGTLNFAVRRPPEATPPPLGAAPVTWRAEFGQIDASGTYRAPPSGTEDVVTAETGGLRGQARVRLAGDLVIEPGTVTLDRGTSAMFRTSARVGGQNVPIQPDSWTVEGGIGSIDGQGRFTASGAGSGAVVVRFGAMMARAAVTVPVPAARLDLAVTPGALRADGKSSAVVTARLVDAAGTTLPKDGVAVAFTVSESDLANLPNALAETRAGVASVQLMAGSRSGVATVQALAVGTGLPLARAQVVLTVPTPARVRLAAHPSAFGSGQAGQAVVSANLVDEAGNPVTNPGPAAVLINFTPNLPGVTLPPGGVSIPVGSSTGSTTMTTVGTGGTFTVSGTGSLPVDPVSISVRAAGPAARLNLRLDSVSAPADGTTPIAATVAISDAEGVVLTSEQGTALFLTIRGPDGGVQTLSQPVVSGVARFAVRQTRVGAYTLLATAGTGSLTPAEATADFTPSSAAPAAGGGSTPTGDSAGGSGGTSAGGTTPADSATGSTAPAHPAAPSAPAPVPRAGTPQPGYSLELVLVQTSYGTGLPLNVEVRVKDALGQLAAGDGPRTVELRSSGDGVTITPAAQVVAGGRATFTVTGLVPGDYSLTAVGENLGQPMATARMTFTGQNLVARAERVEFVAPSLPNAVGVPVAVQVALRTLTGQLATTESRSVTLSTVNPTVSIPQATVSAVGGYATFMVAAAQPGVVSFQASVGDKTGSGTLPFGNGLTGWPVYLGIGGLQPNYPVGSPFTVQVQVRDPYAQVVPTDNGRPVHLLVSGRAATVTPAPTYSSGGVATFVVTPQENGQVALVATSPGLNTSSATAVFGVQQATGLRFQLNPGVTYRSGTPLVFQVAVVDAGGAVVTNDNGRLLTLAASAGVSIANANALTSGGYATFTITSPDVGIKSLLVTGNGLDVGSLAANFSPSGDNPTVAYPTSLAFSLAQSGTLQAGVAVGFQVQVKDQSGQVMTGDNYRTVQVSATGPALVAPTGSTTWAGVASFTLTPTAPGTVVLMATAPGLAPSQVRLNVAANPVAVPPTGSTSTGGGTIATGFRIYIRALGQVAAGGRTLLTVMLVNPNGVPVDEPRVPVTLLVSPGLGTLSSQWVQTPAGVTFTAGASPGTVTVSGTAAGYPVEAAVIQITAP